MGITSLGGPDGALLYDLAGIYQHAIRYGLPAATPHLMLEDRFILSVNGHTRHSISTAGCIISSNSSLFDKERQIFLTWRRPKCQTGSPVGHPPWPASHAELERLIEQSSFVLPSKTP